MPKTRLIAKPDSAVQILADISQIITTSHDADETLQLTARMIAERMRVSACAIYIYDPPSDLLYLKATHGLSAKAVDEVSMSPQEGLIGLVLELCEPVQVTDMHHHPRFKPFPQTGETQFSAFLGIPLLIHRKAFGVLSIHTKEVCCFTEEEEQLLTTIATQISGLIAKALLIKELDETALHYSADVSLRPLTTTLVGTPVASGVSLGKALVLEQASVETPKQETTHSIEEELTVFRSALESTVQDILGIIEHLSGLVSPEEAAIFHVHIMFLEDHALQEKIEKYIHEGFSAAWAIYEVVQEYLVAFENIDDSYLREKGQDLKDVSYRLLSHLGHGTQMLTEKEGILVARQFLPSDIAQLDENKIKGLVTSSGGVVSHAAILARSLLIPAVCISEEALDDINEGDLLALDGQAGKVIIHPDEDIKQHFRNLLVEQERYRDHLAGFRDFPCQTKDKVRVFTQANIGLENELFYLKQYGAEGIGLYRSEIFYLSQESYPSLEKQQSVYANIIQSIPANHPVIFRTLDIGADKAAPYMGFQQEENPFLGYRALRRQIENPTILKTQIKALLLASENLQNVRLLFPMITELKELRQAKAIYRECREELMEQGSNPAELQIGMMFEVPGAVLTCEQFLPEIDFCSIGSNDLTQYVLAVDRNNPYIAHLYDPLHPAVLKMIQLLVAACEKANKPLGLCGEMASDPYGCVILIGLGLRFLSMNAPLIPQVKERLSLIELKEAETLAHAALKADSAQEVRKYLFDFFEQSSNDST